MISSPEFARNLNLTIPMFGKLAVAQGPKPPGSDHGNSTTNKQMVQALQNNVDNQYTHLTVLETLKQHTYMHIRLREAQLTQRFSICLRPWINCILKMT
jgi:hypothetical protein